MKVFTVGAAGAGKTTVCRLLRVIEGLSVLDMDDEIMRLSGVVWPDIPTKVDVIEPQIIKAVCAIPVYEQLQLWAWKDTLDLGYDLTGSLNLSPPITEKTRFTK